MTEYNSFIFDKDIAQAYRESINEVNGIDASTLALGEVEIMIARLLLFIRAIEKQAQRNRQRQQKTRATAAQQTAQGGTANVASAGVRNTMQRQQLNINANKQQDKNKVTR